MPELPEVEARRRAIEAAFHASRLTVFDLYKKGIVRHADPQVQKGIPGTTLGNVDRRGKYLIFGFAGGLKFTLHFGLFGDMAIAGPEEPLKSVCARFVFNNKKSLFILKWASLWFGRGIGDLEKLGPDPLAAPGLFTVDYLAKALSGTRVKMKPFLMDQSVIAGIGAVYADEILFKSGILPDRPAKDLTGKETSRLHQTIGKTLSAAVEKTVTAGKEDRPFLSLEGRKNCPVCGTGIVSTRLAGRRTLFCPSCQH